MSISASEAVPCPTCACWKIAADVNAAAREALKEKLGEHCAGAVIYKEDIADLEKEKAELKTQITELKRQISEKAASRSD